MPCVRLLIEADVSGVSAWITLAAAIPAKPEQEIQLCWSALARLKDITADRRERTPSRKPKRFWKVGLDVG